MSSRPQPAIAAAAWPLLVVCLLFGIVACGQQPNRQGAGSGPGEMPPASVTTETASRTTVLVTADFPGRLHGAREAEVRARVGGILEERYYEEGVTLEEGAALFRIEQAPFQIALKRAEAEQANARAVLSQAEREWRRVSGLHDQGAISERERDRALSELELAQARLALAEAGVAHARLELSYTTVRAPVPGVTGLEALTPGNLVSAGTVLTTVTQLDPIQVRFALPERDAATRRALAANGPPEQLEVELLLPDGSTYERRGRIDFTASTVDARTGNVTLRAEFPNPEHRLVPGGLVRVRLGVDRREDVFLLPAEAVTQGAGGPTVFVLDEEQLARARPVELGPVVNGRQVIFAGLATGEEVVINGQVTLRDGARVRPEAREGRSD